MDCQEVQRLVWAGEGELLPVAAHLEACEDCQVEQRRLRQLLGALAELREELVSPPPDLEPLLLATAARSPLLRRLASHPRFWRGAAVGAAAATVAAFGLIVARRLVRPDLA